MPTIVNIVVTSAGLVPANDLLLVTASGSIFSRNDNIDGSTATGQTVSIAGLVDVNYLWLGGHNNVTIAATGQFTGHSSTCIYIGQTAGIFTATGNNSIVNDGIIEADHGAIKVFGTSNLVVNHGTIFSGDDGIATAANSSGNGTQIFNSGLVEATNGAGLRLQSLGDSFVNSGQVISDMSSGIVMTLGVETVTNLGLIQAKGLAVEVHGHDSVISNQGSLISLFGGGINYTNAPSADLDNTGLIQSYASTISDLSGTSLNLYNSGDIVSQHGFAVIASLSLSADGSRIINSGTITGLVSALVMGSGVDTVTNTGTLNGDVDLGAGNDFFDTRSGVVNGFVAGGDGSDTYLIGDASLVMVEGLGVAGDIDTVKSKVTYQLESNFEALTLLGGNSINGGGNTGNNTLTGNSGENRLFGLVGNDVIAGNAGDDRLAGGFGNDVLYGGDGDDSLVGGAGKDGMAGGAGADSFVFLAKGDTANTQANADSITDFSQGDDLIDLSCIDANASNAAGNDAFGFIGGAAFSKVAGQLHYVQVAGNTFVEYDRNGDSVADGVIKLVGLIGLTAADFVL